MKGSGDMEKVTANFCENEILKVDKKNMDSNSVQPQ